MSPCGRRQWPRLTDSGLRLATEELTMPFTLTSDAFREGEWIPRRFTCDGEDLSPPLAWSGAPDGTESFALIVDDPDAPRGTFTHWLLFDIPMDTTHFAEGMQPGDGGRTLPNDFGHVRYGGPCPPKGHGPHRYRFTMYAVNVPVLRLHGDKRKDLDEALRSHTLASVTLTGKYERK
jgi:Raf kinase inhibitor-like YbhB/YbcL family protein